MAKKIVAIGFEIAIDAIDEREFRSKVSLLDWDIILFKPDLTSFVSWADTYQGKPCLSDDASFRLKEASEHWRREIKQAIEAGKTVVIFLPAMEEVFVATGEHRYSGTGRNRHTTRVVEKIGNYTCIPLQLKPVGAVGASMKLIGEGARLLGALWADFGDMFEYKALLGIEARFASVATKNGDKPVGAIFRYERHSGTLVALPDLDFYPDSFLRKNKEGEHIWTPEAKKFAARFVGAIASLDRALRASSQITPEPTWAADGRFVLAGEFELRSALLEAEAKVKEAQNNKETASEKLKGAGRLRALLYENGKALEAAIIDALQLLGFSASPFKEGGSEFDVVFESAEGRLIGEAEGKDNKAINVDKLRQLHMNINEDLLREEVNAPAKGVLFGNGFRLADPSSREPEFTAKCIAAAEASNTALVTTSQLFMVAQYLAGEANEEYAVRCRNAIISGVGLVSLPEPPKAVIAQVAEVTKDD